jgi:hypothetical protein
MNGRFGHRPAGAGPGFYQPTYLNNLNGITIEELAAKYKGRFAKARNFTLRDTRIILAGGTIAAGEYDFFSKPLNGEEDTLDGGGTIQNKTEDMVNLVEANKLMNGNALIITSFQIQLVLTAREFASVSGGRPVSAGPAAAGTMSACNNMVALHRGGVFTVKIGSDVVSEGRLLDYPPRAHMSGSFGSVDDEGFVQIGSGVPRYLDEVVILPPQQYFSVKWKFPVDLIISQNAQIEYGFDGILLEGVG